MDFYRETKIMILIWLIIQLFILSMLILFGKTEKIYQLFTFLPIFIGILGVIVVFYFNKQEKKQIFEYYKKRGYWGN